MDTPALKIIAILLTRSKAIKTKVTAKKLMLPMLKIFWTMIIFTKLTIIREFMHTSANSSIGVGLDIFGFISSPITSVHFKIFSISYLYKYVSNLYLQPLPLKIRFSKGD